ncbi:hypothetical protein LOD99_8305 [Oopsacas minuta]|uniref:NadR/Ttd14 AAA domain-containing protein n=1 Tax=Oopsacas minuta TaxID=111878 RepID=A0AAV7JGS2_9METZ|nr:hypothetical protein LOD99_8305 [Oopsacas minuta]
MSDDKVSAGTAETVSSEKVRAGLDANKRVIYKVVLTGGPVAGKTTTITELRSFFENIGWKVYSVPETATILLS